MISFETVSEMAPSPFELTKLSSTKRKTLADQDEEKEEFYAGEEDYSSVFEEDIEPEDIPF